MAQPKLKKKLVLKKKQEVGIPVKQLFIRLSWKAEVDLDLMAFYQTHSGEVGGVFSDNIPGGMHGSLKEFPFIELSGDEGVEAQGGDNQEELRIAKLDEISNLFIVVLNFTDASESRTSNFSKYGAQVLVVNQNNETFEIPLDFTEDGHVAVICQIANPKNSSAKLRSISKAITLGAFAEKIPGAKLLFEG